MLEQPMAESQGEWMTVNREEFGFWSFEPTSCFRLVRQRVLVPQPLINANRE